MKRDTAQTIIIVVAVVLIAFDTCLGSGLLQAPLIVIWHLLSGWAAFVSREPEKIQWRWEIIWSVIFYAALLVAGGHYFIRWLYREMKGGQSWRWGWTLRIFLLFILMFAAGTSAVAIVHQSSWIARAPEPLFYPRNERARRVRCASNLRQIGQCIELYAREHAGKYPDDLQQLIIDTDLNPEVLVCPSSNHEKAIGATTQDLAANAHKDPHYSYLYLGKGLVQPVKAELVIAYERNRNHEDDGMNVLFADGHFQWFAAADMRKLLAQIEAGGGKAIAYENR